jgi:hypothetical protein
MFRSPVDKTTRDYAPRDPMMWFPPSECPNCHGKKIYPVINDGGSISSCGDCGQTFSGIRMRNSERPDYSVPVPAPYESYCKF